MNSLSQRIKKFRLLRNYTQAYMADQLQLSAKWYGKLEAGKVRIHVDELEKIASLLEVTLEALLHDPPQDVQLKKAEDDLSQSFIIQVRVTDEQLSRMLRDSQSNDAEDRQ